MRCETAQLKRRKFHTDWLTDWLCVSERGYFKFRTQWAGWYFYIHRIVFFPYTLFFAICYVYVRIQKKNYLMVFVSFVCLLADIYCIIVWKCKCVWCCELELKSGYTVNSRHVLSVSRLTRSEQQLVFWCDKFVMFLVVLFFATVFSHVCVLLFNQQR